VRGVRAEKIDGGHPSIERKTTMMVLLSFALMAVIVWMYRYVLGRMDEDRTNGYRGFRWDIPPPYKEKKKGKP
jgi:hypothetical protein